MNIKDTKGIANSIVTSDMAKGFLDIGVGITDALNYGFTNGIDGMILDLQMKFKSIFGKGAKFEGIGDIFRDIGEKFDAVVSPIKSKFTEMFQDVFGIEFGKAAKHIDWNATLRSFAKGNPFEAIIGSFNKYNKANKESIDTHQANIAGYKEELSAMSQKREQLDGMVTRYDELNKVQDKNASQLTEMGELRQQIAQTDESMVLAYDQDNNPILKNIGSMKLYLKQKEQEEKLTRQTMQNEQNALATDMYERRNKTLKERNELMKEYDRRGYEDPELKLDSNNLQGSASKYLAEQEKINQYNEKMYQKRVENAQLASEEELAIQQKYLNKMSNDNTFKKLADEQKSNIMSLGDSLNWRELSIGQADTLTNQLSNLGDKFVQTTEQMGKTGKAIDKVEESFAKDGSTVKYTKALADLYAQSGKFDNESFQNWLQSVNNDLQKTGNIEKYNKNIDTMAQSISKISGINADTLSKALTMDYFGLDQQTQAFNNFGKQYGVTMADVERGTEKATKAFNQFNNLGNARQNIMEQLSSGAEITFDFVKGLEEIDLGSEMNKVIKGITGNGKLDAGEVEVMLQAIMDIEEDGNLSDEVKQLINEITGQEIFKIEAKVETEVEGGEELKKTKEEWDAMSSEERKQWKLYMEEEGSSEIEQSKSIWDSLEVGEKIQSLLQKVFGKDETEQAGNWFNGLNPKEVIQSLIQKVTGSDLIKEAGDWFNSLNIGEKIQSLIQKVTGSDLIKKAGDWFNGLKVGEKIQSLIQKVVGSDLVKGATETIGKIVDKTVTVTMSVVQSGGNLLDAIANFINSKAGDKTITVTTKVVGKEAVEQLKNAISQMQSKSITISVSSNANAVANQISALKNALSGVNSSSKSFIFSTNASAIVGSISTLRSAVSNIGNGKSINFTSNASAIAGQVTRLSTAVRTMPNGKSINYSTNASSATEKVQSLASAVSSVGGGKTITFNVVTIYSTQGTPTSQSEGGGLPRSIPQPQAISTFESITPSPMMLREIPNPIQPIPTPMVNNLSDSPNPSQMVRALANKTPINPSSSNVLKSIKYNIELLQELENRIEKVSNALGLLDVQMERAVGKEKIGYIKKQNELYTEQQALQKELLNNLHKEKNAIKGKLVTFGFKFEVNDDNLLNYEEKLLAMESEYERLQKLADDASKKSSEYEGKNEKTRKKLSDASKNASKKADDYNDKLSEQKDLLDKYLSLINKDMPNAREEWAELNNKIEENNQLLKDIEREKWTLNIEGNWMDVHTGVQKVQNELDKLDAKIDIADDEEKNELLKQRLVLIEKLKKEQQEEYDFLVKTKNTLQKQLEGFGFKIEGNDIKNYRTIMNQLKENLPEDEFDYVSELAEGFLDLILDGIPKAEQEMIGLNGELKDTKEDLENIEKELKELAREKIKIEIESNMKDVEKDVTEIENALRLLESQMEYAFGQEKLDLLKKQEELLKQQKKELQDTIDYMNEVKTKSEIELSNAGFTFDTDGDINNYTEQLKKLKESLSDDDFEYMKDLADEYLDTWLNKLPDAELGLSDLNNALKDLYKEQLETTKDIEDKITDIYKSEIEERKKMLQKELDDKLKLLKKEQDAYNKMREEAKFEDELDKQAKSIEELNSKIEIAKRDTSISGQKRLQDLIKQLEEEKKELEKITQDKIDQNVNDNYENEMERLEEENKDRIEALEKEWSDSKIAEKVAEALGSGVYEDLGGNMVSLQDKLIEFAEQSGDAVGVLADVVRNELITNLNIALDAFKELDNINDKLNLKQYGIVNGNDIRQTTPTSNQVSKSIIIGDTNINIQSGSDEEILEQVKVIVEERNRKLVKEMTKGMK